MYDGSLMALAQSDGTGILLLRLGLSTVDESVLLCRTRPAPREMDINLQQIPKYETRAIVVAPLA